MERAPATVQTTLDSKEITRKQRDFHPSGYCAQGGGLLVRMDKSRSPSPGTATLADLQEGGAGLPSQTDTFSVDIWDTWLAQVNIHTKP